METNMLDTLVNVKSRLNITTDQYDTFLTQQIQLASDTIETYLRRKILSASYTQHFYYSDYHPCLLLQLFCYPVSAIASITEDGIVLDAGDYRLHKPTGSVLKTDHRAFFFAKETVVAYTSGLDDCPTPILSVLDSVVQQRYSKMLSGVELNFGGDVTKISIPGALSIDFDNSSTNDNDSSFGAILGNNCNVLDPYRSDRAILGSSKLVYIDEEPEVDP